MGFWILEYEWRVVISHTIGLKIIAGGLAAGTTIEKDSN
jgi:hypothetical protein